MSYRRQENQSNGETSFTQRDTSFTQRDTSFTDDNARPVNGTSYTESIQKCIGKYVCTPLSCLCCCVCSPIVTVPDDKIGIISEFSRFQRVVGPGTYYRNIITEQIKVQDELVVPDNHTGFYIVDGQFKELYKPGRYRINPLLNQVLKIEKDIVIEECYYGILKKNGIFQKILSPGKYCVNKYLLEELIVKQEVVVNEHQFGLLLNNGKFEKILSPGNYQENIALNIQIIVKNITIIDEGFNGLLYVDGQLAKTLPPGKYCENQFLREKIVSVNMQTTTKELKPQEVLSKDCLGLTIYSILVYQIIDAHKAVCYVENIDFTIREIIKGVTHQVLSEHDLEYIIANKIQLSATIQERVCNNCKEFGIIIKHIDIKDIGFDSTLRESLAASAIATRIAQSKIISATAEIEIAEKMRQVADLMSTPACSEMRQLESMERICKNTNTRVLLIPPSFTKNDGVMDRVISHQIINEQ